MSAQLHRALEPLGLNMTQMSLLTHFSRHPDEARTIGQLVAIMQMNQPAITKAVKAMEVKNLLSRKSDALGGRVNHLMITKTGLVCLDTAQQACLPTLVKTYGGMTEQQLQQLLELMTHVKDQILFK